MPFDRTQDHLIRTFYNLKNYANSKVAVRRFKKKIETSGIYEGSDEEYREIVLPFWRPFNYKPKKFWYQGFGLREQAFDPRYIPDDLFIRRFLSEFNPTGFERVLENKLYLNLFFPDVEKPTLVLKRINGHVIEPMGSFLTEREACRRLREFERVILKPSDQSRGEGVKTLSTASADDDTLMTFLSEGNRGGDCLVQEFIGQHPVLASFNPTSVNTIRIISFVFKGKVHILSSILRIGAEGAYVDNFHKNGSCRAITPDGRLSDYAVTGEGYTNVDRNGDPLVPVEIPGFDEIVDTVKRIHPRVSHMRWIGWDFAVSPDAHPVIIEMNGGAWHNQRTYGPSFGDLTEEVLRAYMR